MRASTAPPSPAIAASASNRHGEGSPPPQTRVTDRKPNPNGAVLVAEYHQIRPGKGPMFRSGAAFKSDLERFYRDGFRPVTVAGYLSGKFDLPPGSSPVVFTFDDANPSQFQLDQNGAIAPTCALGIWQDFAKTHPDFPIKATFYILPSPWGQPRLVSAKLKMLSEWGCEIGNHTITHPILRKLSDEAVKKEIGGAELYIEHLGVPAPTSLAYPFGSSPRNKQLVHGFTYQGSAIALNNAMLVGAGPARSPNDPKLDRFRIPRIQANSEPYGLDYWMTRFETGKVHTLVTG